MCGWVAIFGRPTTEDELRIAADTLASRGPDGAGERVVADGPMAVGLGHRRLAILDLSPAGAQPMYRADAGVSVIYNGEIYNSPELRRELEARGVTFRSACDTEVLLMGWVEWGDAVLDRIEGIFSFALVDERRGRALLARDRLGVKPLYWARDGDAIVAASAPRAILSLCPGLRSDLDRVAIAQFLTLLWIPHPRTPWTAIHKLPPGSAVSIDGRGTRQWRYWTPPDRGDEILEAGDLREILGAATTRQLLSDVPVGLLLSGGLDSTLLLAFMARFYGNAELHATTASYDAAAQQLEMVPDDLAYARRAADMHPEVSLHEVLIGDDAECGLSELSYHFDDPVADPAAITLYRLTEACPTKVLLSGVGGEELFAGYPRHLALGRAGAVARLPASLRRAASLCNPLLRGATPGSLYALRRNLQKLIRSIGEGSPPHYWRMLAQLNMAEAEALTPGFASDAFGELDAQTAPLASASRADALAFDRDQFLPNLNLAYVDKASMAASVEVRVPLLDDSVSMAACSADSGAFIEGGVTKMPLREAARGLIAPAIIDRPKSGFGAPVRAWFQGSRRNDLWDHIEAAAQAGLVERQAARNVFDAASSGRVDNSLAAWALVCLEAWHREHIKPGELARSAR